MEPKTTKPNTDFQIEVKTVKIPSRKLKASWAVTIFPKAEWADKSDSEIRDWYEEAYDRWNFVTGSDEDLELMYDLEEEIKARGANLFSNEIEDGLLKAMSEEITKEIDAAVLRTLDPTTKVTTEDGEVLYDKEKP